MNVHNRFSTLIPVLLFGIVAWAAPAAWADDERAVRIVAFDRTPSVFSPIVGPISLTGLVEIQDACEADDEETCVLRFSFRINSGIVTVREVAGAIEVTVSEDAETPDDGGDDDIDDPVLLVPVSALFDGSGSTGGPLADGSYNVVLAVEYVEVDYDGGDDDDDELEEDAIGADTSAPINFLLDQTPPNISASTSPPPNAAGWNNTNVTVSFSGTDGLSGIASCTAPATLSSEGAGQSASGTCTDNAGNVSALATASGINIDKTAPTASASALPAPNTNGWNNTDVTVSFSGADALSGIASCTAPATLSSEGAGQSASGTCTDVAGNVSALATASGIDIDKISPIVAITSPTDGAVINTNDITVTGTATDALSGVTGVTCNGVDATLAGPAYSCDLWLSDGMNTIDVVATDFAGNVASTSITVDIGMPQFDVGFQPPGGTAILTLAPCGAGITAGECANLGLTDDDARPVSLSAGVLFPFYAVDHSSFFVNSNGNITFGAGDPLTIEPALADFLGPEPRIAPFFRDLNPALGAGVFVKYIPTQADASQIILTWNAVPGFPAAVDNTFQVTLFTNQTTDAGRIDTVYLTMQNDIGIVGITPGGAAAPVELVDYSMLPLFVSPADSAVAEEFMVEGNPEGNPFDLDDSSLKFSPVMGTPTSYQLTTFVPRTTVIGLVLAPDSTPAPGISVQLFGAPDGGTTEPDGTFTIENVRARPDMVVEASGEFNGDSITGQSAATDGVVDGFTDVGEIETMVVPMGLEAKLIDPDNDPDFGPHIAVTPLSCDGIVGPFALANPVNWFGTLYSQFFVGMNGWVSFTNPFGNVSPFPSTSQFFNTTPWIALNFQDWSPQNNPPRSVTYRDSADLFVVTWHETPRFPGFRGSSTFQLQVDNTTGEWQLLWGLHSFPSGLVGWKGETAPGSVINAGGIPTSLGSVFSTRMADQNRFQFITVTAGHGVRSTPDIDGGGDPIFLHEIIEHSTGPGELMLSHSDVTPMETEPPDYSTYDGPTGTVTLQMLVEGTPQANAKVCFILWNHPEIEANVLKERTDENGYVTFENIPLGSHLSDYSAIDPADGKQKDVFGCEEVPFFSKIAPSIEYEGEEIFMVNNGCSIGPPPGVPLITPPS